MSTNVASVVSHFPDAENGFTSSLASTIASGATNVPLNSVAGYTNGEPAVFVVDPSDVTKKQTFTGIIDTGGVQVTSVVWTAGTNQTHTGGATVVDYATATHIAMMSKGIKVNHTQKGNHKTLTDDNANEWIEQGSTASAVNQVKIANAATGASPVISATGDDTNIGLTMTPKGTGAIKMTSNYDAWVSGLTAPTTVTALGNRSYSLVINSIDYTDRLSAGMRLRTTRTAVAPTQCTSLNGTTQYYSKTTPAGMTFTDDFVVSAWVKLSSYPTAGVGTIASRFNNTSGWYFTVNTGGQIQLVGFNASNANYSQVQSYQSVPLNKWVHVTAQLDMSTFTASTTTSYVMIDGLDVPAAVSRGGTNPTALVQAGNLEIGSYSAGTANSFFPGKIAQVAIYSAKVAQATILASISQGLAGTETSLISAYSFNNSINDLNANANNLTANGSAVATNADSPFGQQADGTISSTLDYGIVTKVAFSTNTTVTVQVPEGCTIPTSGGVSAVSYSSVKIPYGMNLDPGKWKVLSLLRVNTASTSNATYGSFSSGGYALNVPIGVWNVGHQHGELLSSSTTAVHFNISATALTGLSIAAGYAISPFGIAVLASSGANYSTPGRITQYQALSAATTYVMYSFGATTSATIQATDASSEIFADFGLL